MLLAAIIITASFSALIPLLLAYATKRGHIRWQENRGKSRRGKVLEFRNFGRRFGFPFGKMVVEFEDGERVEHNCIKPEGADLEGAIVELPENDGRLRVYSWLNADDLANAMSERLHAQAEDAAEYVRIPVHEGVPGELRIFEDGTVEMEFVTGTANFSRHDLAKFVDAVEASIMVRPGSITAIFQLPLMTPDMVMSIYQNMQQTLRLQTA